MTKRYIIDTSVLLRDPQILARAGDHSIIVPDTVLKELPQRGNRSGSGAIADLVASSIPNGVRIEQAPNKIPGEVIFTDRYVQRLSQGGIDVVRIALYYQTLAPTEQTYVVSNDKNLAKYLASQNIAVITGEEFLGVNKDAAINRQIEEKAVKVVSSQRRYVYTSIILGLITSALGPIIYSNIDHILSAIPVWGTMISLPILGLILFWYRENFSLSYGAFEFCIGTLMACYVFYPEFSYTGLSLIDGLQVIGGLYVMVRGLDNFTRGVAGTRLEGPWKRLFYRQVN